jgi:hypothetical protein
MPMRPLAAGVVLAVVLATGCLPWTKPNPPPPPSPGPIDQKRLSDPADYVSYLNKRASLVPGMQADLEIDCKQGSQTVGINALVAAQQPRSFRLKANILGKAGADFGSNNEEFWYWISRANPPYLFHCSYDDLPKVKQLPFPFQPDMVLMAMGMAQYNRDGKYTVRANGGTIELVETAQSPQGALVYKTTVINAYEAAPGHPQVLAYVLQDKNGKVQCRASIEAVQVVDKTTGATLPSKIKFLWAEAGPGGEKLEMTMRFHDLRLTQFDERQARSLFSRDEIMRRAGIQAVDLAKYFSNSNGVTQGSGTGLQRVNGVR